MFRIWGKLMKNNKFQQDLVVKIEENTLTKEQKLAQAMDEFTMAFDIQKPMWFDKNTKEMIKFSRTHFYEDQFIETVDFDYLEIEIIEEDK